MTCQSWAEGVATSALSLTLLTENGGARLHLHERLLDELNMANRLATSPHRCYLRRGAPEGSEFTITTPPIKASGAANRACLELMTLRRRCPNVNNWPKFTCFDNTPAFRGKRRHKRELPDRLQVYRRYVFLAATNHLAQAAITRLGQDCQTQHRTRQRPGRNTLARRANQFLATCLWSPSPPTRSAR